ncbi:hypothetical protein IJM86_00400 [bacterium]|nr:hypothetical protein [bacterium]
MEEREEVIKNSESVLIILSEFTCSFIKDLCEKYTKKLTILDLYTGMGGKGRKIKGENFDDFHGVMEIYEPFDKKNLFDILKEIS